PVSRQGELLRTVCPRDDAVVPTLVGVFAGAAWHERAAAELFGIRFEGHVTTPLLLSESFDGHPLRKDFVLASRLAKRWPGAADRARPASGAACAGPVRHRLLALHVVRHLHRGVPVRRAVLGAAVRARGRRRQGPGARARGAPPVAGWGAGAGNERGAAERSP